MKPGEEFVAALGTLLANTHRSMHLIQGLPNVPTLTREQVREIMADVVVNDPPAVTTTAATDPGNHYLYVDPYPEVRAALEEVLRKIESQEMSDREQAKNLRFAGPIAFADDILENETRAYALAIAASIIRDKLATLNKPGPADFGESLFDKGVRAGRKDFGDALARELEAMKSSMNNHAIKLGETAGKCITKSHYDICLAYQQSSYDRVHGICDCLTKVREMMGVKG